MLTVQVSGTTLFHVAAKYLGDATQWIRIAQFNGLSDPQISGIVTLLIPNVDASQTGGIANQ